MRGYGLDYFREGRAACFARCAATASCEQAVSEVSPDRCNLGVRTMDRTPIMRAGRDLECYSKQGWG